MPETLKIDGKMNIHIFCATHTILDSVADKVLLPAEGGDMMILMDRAPLFTSVRPGLVWVYNKGLPLQAFYVNKGIAEVRRNICSIVAWGVNAKQISLQTVQKTITEIEEKLHKTHIQTQKEQLIQQIQFLNMIKDRPKILTPPNFE